LFVVGVNCVFPVMALADLSLIVVALSIISVTQQIGKLHTELQMILF